MYSTKNGESSPTESRRIVGIDVGVTTLAVTSDGQRLNGGLNQVATYLCDHYDVIVAEDLNTSNLIRRNPRWAARYRGMQAFVDLLAEKCRESGTELVKVPPQNTSQACSVCGALCDRGSANPFIDRDENAARNVLQLGRDYLQKWRPSVN